MFENFVFAFMVIIAIAAGIWVWWLERPVTEQEQTSTEQEV